MTISGTAWQLYEMGNITIPSQRTFAAHSLKFFGISISAERISGSGSRDMDCFVMIPLDDGAMAVVSSVSVEAGQVASVYTASDGHIFGYADNGAGDNIAPVVTKPLAPWGLPANGEAPDLIFAASDPTFGSTKNKTEHVIYTYTPRWRTLRGSVT